jgi:hypothetical protein
MSFVEIKTEHNRRKNCGCCNVFNGILAISKWETDYFATPVKYAIINRITNEKEKYNNNNKNNNNIN